RQITELWKEGRILPDIKSSVYWECSPAFNAGDNPFRFKTKSATRELPASTQASRTPFAEHLRPGALGDAPSASPSSTTPSTILVIPPDARRSARGRRCGKRLR
ncbi:unnamed protein product, partial [Ectocarpus fasciculatus]